MSRIKKLATRLTASTILTLLILSILTSTVIAEEPTNSVEEAEVNGTIIGDIPSINTQNWSEITIKVEDAFGLNWEILEEKFSYFMREFLWPLPFYFGPEVRKYYGYSSLRFEPEVISGDPDGWFFDVIPSTIGETTGDKTHQIKLRAKIDASKADYSIVVGLKCTRILSNGEEYGSSYFYIPLRAEHYNYVTMVAEDATMEGAPKSIVDFKLDVTNLGFYEDTFMFNIKTDEEIFAGVHEAGLVLAPGETRTVTMSVMLPDKFFDPGTPYNLDIYVYSTGDPEEEYIGNVIVESAGFHLSPVAIMAIAFLVIVIILLYILLKRTPVKTIKLPKIKKEKKEKPVEVVAEPAKKEEPIELEVVKPTVDKKAEAEQRKRQRALEKARRAQEKQKRKQ